ncbi:PD-(D/E)XK nuclease family protein [Pyrobaculum aerophilum]|uniref:DUF3782 domain-containing protein n=1 Tax=Pyrobaculum aerophilum TaxID=13773 RepID=A0A371QZ87_9CREN|nr:PD-(D/E)XK nuclease family protein [Pyrobaculum aerophilum]RFA96092.1 hypothetical protein CGL51_06060 [Pyrobaculum aerophilum]
MSLAEEVKRVLLEHPEILVEVLTARPQIIYEALSKITPWERLATREDVEAVRRETEALRREIADVREKMATKEELKALEERMTAGFEAVYKEIRALEKRLNLRLEALGARWGLASEDAFREGVRELLREAGYAVEKWVYFDSEGHVYGHPSEVELDVVVKDGVVMAVEITAALKRGDLQVVRRKAELYQRVSGRRIDKIIVVTAFIHDRNPALVVAVAEKMGIRVVKPEEAENV